MYGNPAEDWRKLTEHYRRMVDEELLELAAQYNDLTPLAQQVLRDELRLRKLNDPLAPRPVAETWRSPSAGLAWTAAAADALPARPAALFGARTPELVPDSLGQQDTAQPHAGAGPVEYTWKTLLCQCETQEEAWQVAEVLRRARIESWIEGPQTYANSSGSEYASFDAGHPRVLVAADQLDEARAIAAQPIPADIVEQSHAAPPEYEPPVCPKCGAEDPLLDSVDPVNAWKCEACGAEWADEAPETGEGAEIGSEGR